MPTPPAVRALILAVDDDPAVGRAIERDLQAPLRRAPPRPARRTPARRGSSSSSRSSGAGEPVALLVADQRMPGMSGVEFLGARAADGARRQARAAHRLRRHRGRDPRDQRGAPRPLPDEAVEPARGAALPGARRPARGLGGGLRRAALGARPPGGRAPLLGRGARDPRLPGAQRRALPLARRRPTPRRGRLLAAAGARREPPARCSCSRTAQALVQPSQGDVAERVGLHTGGRPPLLRPGDRRRRARRAGGGGLRRLRGPARRCWWSAHATGGQAGQSSRIENYLGFPVRPQRRRPRPARDRPGAAARRRDARRAREVVGIRENGPSRVVTLDGGEEIGGHSVARRDRRPLPRLRGARASRSSPGRASTTARRPAEAAAVEGEDVVVVGAAQLGRTGGARPRRRGRGG